MMIRIIKMKLLLCTQGFIVVVLIDSSCCDTQGHIIVFCSLHLYSYRNMVEELIPTVLRLMKEERYAFLTTLDENNSIQTRLTEPFPPLLTPTNEVHVYIGTLSTTRKVAQLQTNSKATLGFQDANGRGYIVMKGNAALLEDKDFSLRQKYWKTDWTNFFPPGAPASDDYTLIRFTPYEIEVVHYDEKIMPGKNWKPCTLHKGEADSNWKVVE